MAWAKSGQDAHGDEIEDAWRGLHPRAALGDDFESITQVQEAATRLL